MNILYSGSGPKADQGYLTLRALEEAAPATAWPSAPPIPGFWSFCPHHQSLCGIHIAGRQAEIWLWPTIDQSPRQLMVGPARQAWYFPTLSADQQKLAVITTPDRFYPRLHQHPAQLVIFAATPEGWQPLGVPTSCLIEPMAWQGDDLLFQDRHGRLVRAAVGPHGVAEAGQFMQKRAHTPRIAPDGQRIAARYGNHLVVGATELVLAGQICDHGWITDQRLWAVVDDGFWRCRLIWLDIDAQGLITPQDAGFETTRVDQLVFI